VEQTMLDMAKEPHIDAGGLPRDLQFWWRSWLGVCVLLAKTRCNLACVMSELKRHPEALFHALCGVHLVNCGFVGPQNALQLERPASDLAASSQSGTMEPSHHEVVQSFDPGELQRVVPLLRSYVVTVEVVTAFAGSMLAAGTALEWLRCHMTAVVSYAAAKNLLAPHVAADHPIRVAAAAALRDMQECYRLVPHETSSRGMARTDRRRITAVLQEMQLGVQAEFQSDDDESSSAAASASETAEWEKSEFLTDGSEVEDGSVRSPASCQGPARDRNLHSAGNSESLQLVRKIVEHRGYGGVDSSPQRGDPLRRGHQPILSVEDATSTERRSEKREAMFAEETSIRGGADSPVHARSEVNAMSVIAGRAGAAPGDLGQALDRHRQAELELSESVQEIRRRRRNTKVAIQNTIDEEDLRELRTHHWPTTRITKDHQRACDEMASKRSPRPWSASISSALTKREEEKRRLASGPDAAAQLKKLFVEAQKELDPQAFEDQKKRPKKKSQVDDVKRKSVAAGLMSFVEDIQRLNQSPQAGKVARSESKEEKPADEIPSSPAEPDSDSESPPPSRPEPPADNESNMLQDVHHHLASTRARANFLSRQQDKRRKRMFGDHLHQIEDWNVPYLRRDAGNLTSTAPLCRALSSPQTQASPTSSRSSSPTSTLASRRSLHLGRLISSRHTSRGSSNFSGMACGGGSLVGARKVVPGVMGQMTSGSELSKSIIASSAAKRKEAMRLENQTAKAIVQAFQASNDAESNSKTAAKKRRSMLRNIRSPEHSPKLPTSNKHVARVRATVSAASGFKKKATFAETA